MRPDPLIQKFFAIERAIGYSDLSTLRLMVIEAEESALQLELDLHRALRRQDAPKRAA
jgi:hypothetical protein